jgi:lambda family phage portal protein
MRLAIAAALQRMGDRMALGYDAGERNRVRKDLGWARATPSDEDSLLSIDGTRELIRQKANDLRRNNPVVSGACDRLNVFAVGCGIRAQAETDNDDWNKSSEQFFTEWRKVCDYRQRVRFWDFERMAVSLRPTHGGIYLQLMDNGQIVPIECERIRDPLKDKPEGMTEGVRLDAAGRIQGYLIHSRDKNGTFTGPHDSRFVPRAQIIPVIAPAWRPDQVREVPDLASVVTTLQDLHEMNQYTLATAKWQSQNVGALKKQSGSAPNVGQRGSGSTVDGVGQRQTFKTDWGQIWQMFPGEEIQHLQSQTPGIMHIPYMQFQLGLAASALGVPYEFLTLDFSKLDYSRQKGVLLFINHALRPWRHWLTNSMHQRIWNWRIAMAIKAGDLPPAPTEVRNGVRVSQWWRVKWQAPEELWIDRQESAQADTYEYQMGLGDIADMAGRRGHDREDLLRAKARDMKLAERIEREEGLPAGSLVKVQIPGQADPAAKPAGRPPVDNSEDE